MKGIILAGGKGNRLYPLTTTINKQLLPVYDKPMIYYPLATLMLAGIRDILIISTPDDIPAFRKILGDGEKFGIRLSYAAQEKPEGIAHAFIVGREFIKGDKCALILGDNIFYGNNFQNDLRAAMNYADEGCATIFSHYVPDPEHFGIAQFDAEGNVLSIEEKPAEPKSNYCVTGLYFYDERVSDLAATLKPSERGQLDITDLNRLYLEEGKLKVRVLGRGFAWLDAGTIDSLMSASVFIQTVQSSQGVVICSPEEIAYYNKWITREQLIETAHTYAGSSYGSYLLRAAQANIMQN